MRASPQSVVLCGIVTGLAQVAAAQVPTEASPEAQGEEIFVETSDYGPGSTGAPRRIEISSSVPDQAPPASEPDQMPPAPLDPAAQPATKAVTLESFESALEPYGAWITLDGVGRVWQPYPSVVGAGFKPYVTAGRWVYTEYGWTFVSDWEWGWAPFHYGRWWLDTAYGWVWDPDTVWGPGWVSWRDSDEYIGWSPLTPFDWAFGADVWTTAWCFIASGYFLSSPFPTYAVPVNRVAIVFGVTTGETARGGPPVANVTRATGEPVRTVAVAQTGAVPPSLVSSTLR